MQDMLSIKIFFQILFAWQENDLGLDLPSKKWYYKKTHAKKTHPKQPTFPTYNQHQLKCGMIRVQYLGHWERVHRSFMKQYNLCDCRYHCRRLNFCLNSLRYMYVFKIYVRAYFNQQLSVGIYTDQIHLQ